MNRWAYLAFNGGAHQCIGNHFALLEGQLILATWLQRLSFRHAGTHIVSREAGLTMRPRGGFVLTLE